MGQGLAGHIGIQIEPAWKQAQVNSMYFAYGMEESVILDISRFDYKNISAKLTEPDDMAGVRYIKGGLVLPMFTHAAWHIFRGLMQTQSNYNISATGSTWTATYKSPDGDYKPTLPRLSHTVEIYRNVTSSFQYTGCMFTRVDVQVDINQPVLLGTSLLGGATTITSKSTPVYVEEQNPLSWDVCSIGMSGVGIDKIESFTLSVDNQLDVKASLNNSTDISGIRQIGGQTIRFSGKLDFDNITEYNKYVNQTEYSLNVSFKRSTPTESLITFTLPRVSYTKFTAQVTGKERVLVDMEGRAKFHTGSLTSIQIDVSNQYDYGYLVIGHPVYGVIGSRNIW